MGNCVARETGLDMDDPALSSEKYQDIHENIVN